MHTFARIALVLVVTALGSPARADITVCNDFRAAVSVALAYEEGASATSEGWWKVEPNACREIPFKGVDFYYAAESDSYRDAGRQKRDLWGKGRNFYVGKGTFKYDNAEKSRRGARSVAFSKVTIGDVHRGKPHLVTVRFRPGGTTVEVKSKPAA